MKKLCENCSKSSECGMAKVGDTCEKWDERKSKETKDAK